MYIMNHEPIVDHSDSSSQDGQEDSRFDDGIRILGRIIARNLLAKRLAQTKKNIATDSDTGTPTDRS
jgi:hypothetical protein